MFYWFCNDILVSLYYLISDLNQEEMAIGEEINHLNQIVIDAFRNKSLAQPSWVSYWPMLVALMIDDVGWGEGFSSHYPRLQVKYQAPLGLL